MVVARGVRVPHSLSLLLQVADYLRAAHAMDASIGRLLNKLDAMGAAKDTVVVYTSDQGYTHTPLVAAANAAVSSFYDIPI